MARLIAIVLLVIAVLVIGLSLYFGFSTPDSGPSQRVEKPVDLDRLAR